VEVIPLPCESGLASEEEIRRRIDEGNKFREIGVDIYSVDNLSEHENPYRAEAIKLITCGKDVPVELKDKIYQYDRELEKKLKGKNK